MTLRTFIAVEIGALDELVKFEDEIRGTGAEVKLVEPENIHITLKFLGDTDDELVDNIIEIIRESGRGIKPFKLELRGTGAFPNLNYMKVLWVSINGYEPLVAIANSLNTKLKKLGFKSDKRGFKPHVTIGRVKSKKHKNALKDLLVRNKSRFFHEIKVESVYLKKSILDSMGPTYYNLGKVELE